MKIPKQINTYCPSCRKHTTHKVRQQRKNPARSLSWGQRQFLRVQKGYGSQPRSEQRTFAKTTKKATLILECTECGKKHVRSWPRTKRLRVGE